MPGDLGKWRIVLSLERRPKRHAKRRSAKRTRFALWLGAAAALLPLAVACGADEGNRAGDQHDRVIIAEARSSFCTTFAGMNIYGGPEREELDRYAASLRRSAEDLERVGDTEFAEAARRLASGMEAAQEVTELSAYLNDDLRAPRVSQLMRGISRMPGVGDIEFISKEEAHEEFKRLYGDDPEFSEEIAALQPGTLPASFRVVVKSSDDLSKVRNQLESEEGVERVVTPSGLGLAELDQETLREVVRVCLFEQTDESQEGARTSGARINYEVRLRDGGSVQATIQYRLPSGKLQTEQVRTPWSSSPMAFEDGDLMFVRAETKQEVDSPLLCVLASQKVEEGAYVLARVDDPLSACETEYELGQWPPDDDDPIGNPLIRVG
jgi:hypothetical protein